MVILTTITFNIHSHPLCNLHPLYQDRTQILTSLKWYFCKVLSQSPSAPKTVYLIKILTQNIKMNLSQKPTLKNKNTVTNYQLLTYWESILSTSQITCKEKLENGSPKPLSFTNIKIIKFNQLVSNAKFKNPKLWVTESSCCFGLFLISLITKLHSNISSVSKPNKSLKNALVDKLYFFLHKLKWRSFMRKKQKLVYVHCKMTMLNPLMQSLINWYRKMRGWESEMTGKHHCALISAMGTNERYLTQVKRKRRAIT